MSCQQRDPSTPVQISNIYTATMMDRFVFGGSCHHHLFLNCHLNSRSWWMIPVIPYSRHIPSDRPFSSSGDHRPHKLLLILLSYVSWTTFMAPFIGTERKCSAVNVQEGEQQHRRIILDELVTRTTDDAKVQWCLRHATIQEQTSRPRNLNGSLFVVELTVCPSIPWCLMLSVKYTSTRHRLGLVWHTTTCK